ncbi:amino acid adenylation domain-containing protein [Rhizobium changzhiense]|uniref:non-ribosomal peptide synthetase n=1 Tax=Rhizobium changzhiense TaxID=2692317 RepID=UPI001F0BB457|nr:amino acid adenylation domain-containing protein [Rhizobium changzhiense]MCH4547464.1 amino acid adenylation domain-containing protein [Rhizobium changzhiense]
MIAREYMASRSQKALWFLSKLQASAAYNIGLAIELTGKLDIPRLTEACQTATARHPILMSAFEEMGGDLTAVVTVFKPNVAVTDLPGESGDATEAVREFVQCPYNLHEGPLVRFGVFRASPHRHILCIGMHHIVGDLGSARILLDEIERIYLTGEYQDIDTAFFDFAETEMGYLSSPEHKSDVRAWHQTLDRNVRHSLPLALSGPTSTVSFELPALPGRFEGPGSFSVLLTTWMLAFRDVVGSDCLAVGVPISLRPSRNAVGNFVNTLPILAPENSNVYSEVISRIQADIIRCVTQRHVPFSAIVEDMAFSRRSDQNPVFSTLFNLLRPSEFGRYPPLTGASHNSVSWGGLMMRPWTVPQQDGQVPLAVNLVQSDRSYLVSLKSATRDVSASQLKEIEAAWLHHLRKLDCQAIQRFVASSPTWGKGTVVKQFDDVAFANPDRVAVVDGETEFTYRDIQHFANGLAHELLARGVTARTKIGVYLPPSAECIWSLLGILKAGCTYVPLDPEYPIERLASIAQSSELALIVCRARDAERANAAGPTIVLEETKKSAILYDKSVAAGSAYILFTSGSTGMPKGIEVRHQNVSALLAATSRLIATSANDAWLWFHALSFDLSVWEIFGCLSSGATLIIAAEDVRRNPRKLIQLINAFRVTVVQLTPSALRLAMLAMEAESALHFTIRPRHLISCGEALPLPTARYFSKRVDNLWNMYGPAETTVYATYYRVDDSVEAIKSVPIGRPLAGYQIHILDDHGNSVDPGSVGELYISGSGVSKGYPANPDLTKERFLPVPTSPGEQMYRTGDFGRWDGEDIEYCGRKDQQIKINGYRVEILEIEQALQRHPLVGAGAVLMDETADFQCLVGFVTRGTGCEDVNPMEILNDLKKQLPDYMLPQRLICLNDLPMNAHKKVDRSRLKLLLGSQKAEPVHQLSQADVKELIVAIWKDALGKEEISETRNFFDEGGNSFILATVHERFSREAKLKRLTLVDLFRYPTVSALVAHLRIKHS